MAFKILTAILVIQMHVLLATCQKFPPGPGVGVPPPPSIYFVQSPFPVCNSYTTYNTTRATINQCNDAVNLQRILLEGSFNVNGNGLVPFLPRLGSISRVDKLEDLWIALDSLLGVVQQKDVLQGLHSTPTLTLTVLNKVISDSCIRIRQAVADSSFDCNNATQIATLKHKLELFKAIADVAPLQISPPSPLAVIADSLSLQLDNQHYCNYWSSHMLGNCAPRIISDQRLVVAHQFMDGYFQQRCSCKICTLTDSLINGPRA